MIRKMLVFNLILFALLSLTACAGKPLPEGFDKAAVEQSAKVVVETVNAGDGPALVAMSNPVMADVLTDALLNDIFEDIQASGAFIQFGEMAVSGVTDTKAGIEYAMVIMKTDYEMKDLVYTISFDKDMKLAGLYYK